MNWKGRSVDAVGPEADTIGAAMFSRSAKMLVGRPVFSSSRVFMAMILETDVLGPAAAACSGGVGGQGGRAALPVSISGRCSPPRSSRHFCCCFANRRWRGDRATCPTLTLLAGRHLVTCQEDISAVVLVRSGANAV